MQLTVPLGVVCCIGDGIQAAHAVVSSGKSGASGCGRVQTDLAKPRGK